MIPTAAGKVLAESVRIWRARLTTCSRKYTSTSVISRAATKNTHHKATMVRVMRVDSSTGPALFFQCRISAGEVVVDLGHMG
jgi:hypothetical protein